MVSPGVEIEGLAEFRRALKRVDDDLPKDLRATMRRQVADPVALRVKSQVPVLTGTWRSTIRGGATARTAYIQWGRAKVPYAGWMEFGGQLPSQRSGRPARYVRRRVGRGYYVHPEVERARPLASAAAERALEQVMRRAQLSLN